MAGNDKTGKSKKIGRNGQRCGAYRVRESQGKTAKTRRILRALLRGQVQPGWRLTQDHKRAFRSI